MVTFLQSNAVFVRLQLPAIPDTPPLPDIPDTPPLPDIPDMPPIEEPDPPPDEPDSKDAGIA